MNILVTMKDSSKNGQYHEHNDVTVEVVEGVVLKVTYRKSSFVVSYPLANVESWTEH